MKVDSQNARFRFRGSAKPTEDSVILDLQDKIHQKDREIERLRTSTRSSGVFPIDKGTNTLMTSQDDTPVEHVNGKSTEELNNELREQLAQAYTRQQQLELENCDLKTEVESQVGPLRTS